MNYWLVRDQNLKLFPGSYLCQKMVIIGTVCAIIKLEIT